MPLQTSLNPSRAYLASTQQEYVLSYLKGVLGANSPLIGVARCESHLRQWEPDGTPLPGEITPADTGVFQINKDYHLDHATELGIDLDTLEGNVEYAQLLYKTQGLKPWRSSAYCWNK